jgi:hypothetical protein
LIVTALLVSMAAGSTRAVAQSPPDGWVVLGVEDYRALRTRAMPPTPPPPSLPVDAALTRIDYDLRVDSDSVVGTAVLTIDVLKDGWVRVPIPAGVMVRDARLDGQPVSLVDGAPAHVLLSRPGRSQLTLDLVLAIAQAAGAESLVLPPSAAPVSRVAVALPKSGVDLSVTGGFVLERSESDAGSRWVMYARPNQPMTVRWKRRVDDRRSTLPLRARAHVTELAALGEDVCQITASVALDVVQGLARDVSVQVPAGVIVNQVNGPTVADWDMTDGTLRVSLLEPTTTNVSFLVNGEMRAPREGAIAVPLVRVPSAERETGGIAVEVVGAGEIRDRQARAMEAADAADLGDLVSGRGSPSTIAYRFKPLNGTESRSLTVDVVRYTPQAVLVANVEEARYRILAAADGWQLVEARYAVRNNQRSFLKVTLGADTTVWSAAVAGRPMRPGLAAAGELLLPLEKGRAGEDAPTFLAEVIYLRHAPAWIEKGRARVELPSVDLPISRTGVTFHYPPGFRVALAPGTFRTDVDAGPTADAFRIGVSSSASRAETKERDSLQALVDTFKKDAGRTVAGILPVSVTFPAFGPALFLASELTAESRVPAFDVTYRRVKE